MALMTYGTSYGNTWGQCGGVGAGGLGWQFAWSGWPVTVDHRVALQQQHTAAAVSGISSLGGRNYVNGMEASCFLDHLCLKIRCPSLLVKALSSVAG